MYTLSQKKSNICFLAGTVLLVIIDQVTKLAAQRLLRGQAAVPLIRGVFAVSGKPRFRVWNAAGEAGFFYPDGSPDAVYHSIHLCPDSSCKKICILAYYRSLIFIRRYRKCGRPPAAWICG